MWEISEGWEDPPPSPIKNGSCSVCQTWVSISMQLCSLFKVSTEVKHVVQSEVDMFIFFFSSLRMFMLSVASLPGSVRNIRATEILASLRVSLFI